MAAKLLNLRRLSKQLRDLAKDQAIRDAVGADAVRIIKGRTRLGRGVSDQGGSIRLAPLSPSYKRFRKLYASKLGEFGSVNKSNLTMTGQMLNAIKHRRGVTGSIVIYVNKRTRRNPFSKKAKKLTNAQVAEYVAENGRPFLGLDRQESKIIQGLWLTLVREKIRKGGIF
jgi:hypothetical protein